MVDPLFMKSKPARFGERNGYEIQTPRQVALHQEDRPAIATRRVLQVQALP